MKTIVMLFLLVTVGLLAGCGGNMTAKNTTANTLFAMHDLVKIGGAAANQMCINKQIQPESCMKIKSVYDKARLSYPIASDALVVYLKSEDKTVMQNFLSVETLFVNDYQELFKLLTEFGVLKTMDTGGTQ